MSTRPRPGPRCASTPALTMCSRRPSCTASVGARRATATPSHEFPSRSGWHLCSDVSHCMRTTGRDRTYAHQILFALRLYAHQEGSCFSLSFRHVDVNKCSRQYVRAPFLLTSGTYAHQGSSCFSLKFSTCGCERLVKTGSTLRVLLNLEMYAHQKGSVLHKMLCTWVQTKGGDNKHAHEFC